MMTVVHIIIDFSYRHRMITLKDKITIKTIKYVTFASMDDSLEK